MEHTILVVEDEQGIREAIGIYMKNQGYNVILAANGKEGLEKIKTNDIHLAIVDIMMPVMDGISMVMEARKHHDFPILFLSAKSEDIDKITGLNIGADDYIMKPFDSKELVARVKAVLRRFQPAKTESVVELKCVEYPDLTVNLSNYSVMYNGHPIDMPPKELELLYFLAASPNQVFTREQLLDHIWGYEYIGDTRTVDVHIKRLREKIKGNDSWALTTVWGIGYKFEVKNI